MSHDIFACTQVWVLVFDGEMKDLQSVWLEGDERKKREMGRH